MSPWLRTGSSYRERLSPIQRLYFLFTVEPMLTKYLFTLLFIAAITRIWAWPIRMHRSRQTRYQSPAAYKPGLPDSGRRLEQIRRHKRLMGIFRCNGWGPGCTHFHDPVQPTGTKAGLVKSLDMPMLGRSGYGGWSRHANFIFEPFFTLTSGKWLCLKTGQHNYFRVTLKWMYIVYFNLTHKDPP